MFHVAGFLVENKIGGIISKIVEAAKRGRFEASSVGVAMVDRFQAAFRLKAP